MRTRIKFFLYFFSASSPPVFGVLNQRCTESAVIPRLFGDSTSKQCNITEMYISPQYGEVHMHILGGLQVVVVARAWIDIQVSDNIR